MNCKAGDLAIYVGPDHSCRGHIARCVRLEYGFCMFTGKGGHGWLIDPPFLDGVGMANDASLRPLRNPGDDDKDESYLWLPAVPKHEPTEVV